MSAIKLAETQPTKTQYMVPGFLQHMEHELAHQAKNRFIINIPPRHGKTAYFGHWYILDQLNKNPEIKILYATYDLRSAAHTRDKLIADIIGNSQYLNVRIDRVQSNEVVTTMGGRVKYTSPNSVLNGKGADLIIIDDPYKNAEEAFDPLHREKVSRWYHNSIHPRLDPFGRIILVMNRWHKEDLCGELADQMWKHAYPAIDNGRALWPERYSVGDLRDIQRCMPPHVWSAMYQQFERTDRYPFA